MINGLEGIPGSGKSYEATVFHVLEALKNGRLVITNLPLNVEMFAAIDPSYRALIQIRKQAQPIRGTWDASRVDVDTGKGNAFELFDTPEQNQKPDVNVSLFGHVWDYFCVWKHAKTGQGPLFVIDECHVPMPKVGTDKQVIEWYKLSRHFNADVLLMTQSFRDMNPMIAGLLAILVKVRKADILGRADHYIRKVQAGYRGAVISTEQRRYEPAFFNLYKSHTQGNSVMEALATDVVPFLVKFNRFRNLFFVIILIGIGWAVWVNAREKPKKPHPIQSRIDLAVADAKANPVEHGLEGMKQAALTKVQTAVNVGKNVDPEDDPEPFQAKEVHLTGMMRMGPKVIFTFTVSKGSTRILDLTEPDLIAAGYTWHPTGHCTGVLKWRDTRKAVTCDAPRLAAGDNERPHVVAVPGVQPKAAGQTGGAPLAGIPGGV
ncbi:MAG: zonular occludens toxin domain-containing protein [Variovorax sp.]